MHENCKNMLGSTWTFTFLLNVKGKSDKLCQAIVGLMTIALANDCYEIWQARRFLGESSKTHPDYPF